MIIGLLILFALMIGIGFWAGRGVHDFASFALSRGHFSGIAIASTVVASGVGGGVVVGMAEKGYAIGIGCAIGLLGFAFQLAIMGWLAPRFHKLGMPLSVGEIIGQKYGRIARLFTGFLWIAFCAGILAAQLSALGSLLCAYLPFSSPTCAALGAAALLLYCCVGGIRAVVMTDLFQLALMILALPVVVWFAVSYVGGWSEIVAVAPKEHWSPVGHLTWWQLGAIFLSFLMGDIFIPPMVQRVLITPSARQARRAFFQAAVVAVPFCLMSTVLGLAAYCLDSELLPAQALPFLFDHVLPAGLRFIAAIGLVAAILSSADSYLHAASVAVVRDLCEPMFGEEAAASYGLSWARLSTLCIGGMALLLAAGGTSAVDLLLHTYAVWGPMMVVPLFLLLLGRPLSKAGFLASILAGTATLLIWELGSFEKGTGVGGAVPGIFMSAFSASFATLWGRLQPRLIERHATH